MKRLFAIVCGIALVLVPVATVQAYNQGLASSYDQFFQPFTGGATAKSLQMMKIPDFVNALKKGEKITVLDIRTPAETGIFVMSVPQTLVVPMDQVFKPDNLARIPKDQKVVVVCKAGHRATAVAMALRHVGFKSVFILKGGAVALVNYLTPKTAY